MTDDSPWQVSRYDGYFLFTGRGSFELKLLARAAHQATVVPVDDPDGHKSLLRAWWRYYNKP